MVTDTDALLEPPAPVQVSVKVVSAFRAPVLAEPAVGRVPDHPPEAVQDVACMLDQVSMELVKAATTGGSAEMVTLGPGVEVTTSTVTDWMVVPPAPLQMSVYVLLALRAPLLTDPLVARIPDHAPDAMHDVASVLVQVSVELVPCSTEGGLAVSVTSGGPG